MSFELEQTVATQAPAAKQYQVAVLKKFNEEYPDHERNIDRVKRRITELHDTLILETIRDGKFEETILLLYELHDLLHGVERFRLHEFKADTYENSLANDSTMTADGKDDLEASVISKKSTDSADPVTVDLIIRFACFQDEIKKELDNDTKIKALIPKRDALGAIIIGLQSIVALNEIFKSAGMNLIAAELTSLAVLFCQNGLQQTTLHNGITHYDDFAANILLTKIKNAFGYSTKKAWDLLRFVRDLCNLNFDPWVTATALSNPTDADDSQLILTMPNDSMPPEMLNRMTEFLDEIPTHTAKKFKSSKSHLRTIVKSFKEKILKRSALLPTQLRDHLVGLKNFVVTFFSTGDKVIDLFQSGAPTQPVKKHKKEKIVDDTELAFMVIGAATKAKIIKLITLVSPWVLDWLWGRKDKKIKKHLKRAVNKRKHKRSMRASRPSASTLDAGEPTSPRPQTPPTEELEQIVNFTIIPFNGLRRILWRSSIDRRMEKNQELIDTLFTTLNQKFTTSQQPDATGTTRKFNSLSSEDIVQALLNDENANQISTAELQPLVKQFLQIDARLKTLKKEYRRGFSNLFGLWDPHNLNLEIATLSVLLRYYLNLFNRLLNQPDELMIDPWSCVSGKDRSTVLLINIIALFQGLRITGGNTSIFDILNSKAHQQYVKKIADSQHHNCIPGGLGGTIGAFPVKEESISGMDSRWGNEVVSQLSNELAKLNTEQPKRRHPLFWLGVALAVIGTLCIASGVGAAAGFGFWGVASMILVPMLYLGVGVAGGGAASLAVACPLLTPKKSIYKNSADICKKLGGGPPKVDPVAPPSQSTAGHLSEKISKAWHWLWSCGGRAASATITAASAPAAPAPASSPSPATPGSS